MENHSIVPSADYVAAYILLARGQKVILDTDLAKLYGVTTRRLNEQVRRNRDRFPPDFMFRLNQKELHRLKRSDLDKDSHGGRRYSPIAFTEHGALMAANVINSEQAVKVSVLVVRVFVKLREMIGTHQELARKVEQLEQRLDSNDDAILKILETIKLLMDAPPPTPPEPKRKLIGFEAEKEGN